MEFVALQAHQPTKARSTYKPSTHDSCRATWSVQAPTSKCEADPACRPPPRATATWAPASTPCNIATPCPVGRARSAAHIDQRNRSRGPSFRQPIRAQESGSGRDTLSTTSLTLRNAATMPRSPLPTNAECQHFRQSAWSSTMHLSRRMLLGRGPAAKTPPLNAETAAVKWRLGGHELAMDSAMSRRRRGLHPRTGSTKVAFHKAWLHTDRLEITQTPDPRQAHRIWLVSCELRELTSGAHACPRCV